MLKVKNIKVPLCQSLKICCANITLINGNNTLVIIIIIVQIKLTVVVAIPVIVIPIIVISVLMCTVVTNKCIVTFCSVGVGSAFRLVGVGIKESYYMSLRSILDIPLDGIIIFMEI